MEAASIAHAVGHDTHGGAGDSTHAGTGEHHGPPAANASSRVNPSLLGMMLFIISEIMVFGAFFTAYFFIRVAQGDPWPAPGTKLPIAVAGFNTAILVSSSFTIHWAEQSIKRGNRFGLKAGMLTTFLLGCTFLFIQINEYANIGFAPQDHAQQTIFYSLTGLHGAHVFIGLCLLLFVTIRSFRGHYSAESHRGVEVPGIYWHFVDIMWIIVYLTVYVI
jgi:cytochrome c oxidase subunit 3